jgi:hypothetical protein
MIRKRIGPGVPVPMAGRNARPTNQLDLTLDGGTAELFKFPTGTPFIGVEKSR